MRMRDFETLLTTLKELREEIIKTEELIMTRTDWDAETRAKIEGGLAGMWFALKEIGDIDIDDSGEPWIHHGMWAALGAIERLAEITGDPSCVERFKKQVRW